MPEPIEVLTSDLDIMALLRQSVERHEAMKARAGAYDRTSLDMQDIGLLGEKAVAHWLAKMSLRVEEVGDDPTKIKAGAGDVAIVRTKQFGTLSARQLITLEVKTSRRKHWRRYERTLDAKQLARTQADAYVWCVVDDTWPTHAVRLMGWLPTPEVKQPSAGRPTVEHGRRHVRITRPMRDVRTMTSWLEEIATPWS